MPGERNGAEGAAMTEFLAGVVLSAIVLAWWYHPRWKARSAQTGPLARRDVPNRLAYERSLSAKERRA
jgi:hypothetical protein